MNTTVNNEGMNIISKISSPKDIKNLSIDKLSMIADAMRPLIINKTNEVSGHIGGNLGIIEMSIALHYVFNSPQDKIIFDVSHQCYPHKILTGRAWAFMDQANYGKVSGFSNPDESEHDPFIIGHTSTAVSLAVGTAKIRDLKGGKENVIAILGDGSLSGGEAFEGLDNAAMLNSNIIIVINDNEMSIAENYGGVYKNLEELRKTNGKAKDNFFKSMGFDYYYLEEGNNIEKLIETFKAVKDITHPSIVHVHTLKGKGLKVAEDQKERFHWIFPHEIDRATDGVAFELPANTYQYQTAEFLINKVKKDRTIVAINPATPMAVGFSPRVRNQLKDNYIDPGITEQHTFSLASAIAKQGGKPVVSVLSSFIQRAYDQISQDIALNQAPVTVLVYIAGLTPEACTHVGSFDIPLISNIPNVVYLSPTCLDEYMEMLSWSIDQDKHPVFIRVPLGEAKKTGEKYSSDYSMIDTFKLEHKGSSIAIIGAGEFYSRGVELSKKIKEELRIDSSVINPRFISGIDSNLLSNLEKDHNLVVTIENGVLDGGFGEKVSRFYSSSSVKVLNFGGKKEFIDRLSLDEIYKRNNLDIDGMFRKIKEVL